MVELSIEVTASNSAGIAQWRANVGAKRQETGVSWRNRDRTSGHTRALYAAASARQIISYMA